MPTAATRAVRDLPPVVHLTSEYFPYARTGGLAEAVSGLATFQQRAGQRALALLPLYRSVRESAPGLVPVGDAFEVPLGPSREPAQLLRVAAPGAGPEVYAIAHPHFFERDGLYGDMHGDFGDNHRRFGFFVLAALEVLPRLVPGRAILHAHDWHAALAPMFLRLTHAGRPGYAELRTVLSVHNPGYQGHFPPGIVPELGIPWEAYDWRCLEWYGKANLLKAGVSTADMVVTVSPQHARELLTPEGGFGLQEAFHALGDRLVGILNGIDQQTWNPATDLQITARFAAGDLEGKERCKAALQRAFGLPQRTRTPLFAFAGRLARQKGLDVILGSLGLLGSPAQFIFLGSGERRYGEALLALQRAAPDRIGVDLAFTDRVEHRLMAGADLLMMPSEYEPCGLTQMRAQRYGAIPVARRVGGLADTIDDGVTGFLFDAYAPPAFEEAAFRALAAYEDRAAWGRMMDTAMHRDFGWERAVERYAQVYQRALEGP